MKKTAPTSTSPASPPKSRRRPKADTPIAPPPRKKMPAEVFVKIWMEGEKAMVKEEWLDFVILGKHHSGILQIEFSDIEVEGRICIEKNRSHLLHLVLLNCDLPTIELVNAKILSVEIKKNSEIQDFSIEANSDVGYLFIDGNSKMWSFYISNSKTEDFFIRNSAVEDFEIRHSEVGKFGVDGSTTGNFTIKNSTTKQFEIRNSTILGFSIKNSKTDYFLIDDTASSNFLLQDADSTVLQISGNSRLREVFILHSNLQGIEINSGSFINHLQCRFNLKEPVRLLLDRSFFGHLDFNNSAFAEFTTVSISTCKVNQLTLNNCCNYGAVFFSGLKPLKEWEDFKKDEDGNLIFEEGSYQFETVTDPPNSTLRLTDSDLGKMQFINCDLRQFQRFEFSNTKMLDVFVAGSQMPGNKAFFLPNDEQNLPRLAEQKRLAYGQFKKIYEARGDVAGSLPYLAYELEAYRQQLQMEGWRKHWGELFMLWMNKLSTNYGVSWQRGLAVTIVAMTFFYSVFCWLIGYRFGNDSPDDVGRFWELVSYTPYYLNPLRDNDSISLIKEDGFTPLARIWDFISRIFIAYFVYQTIQAFRKLGKSSG